MKIYSAQRNQHLKTSHFLGQCGFPALIEKLKEASGRNDKLADMLTDLPKTFDCIDHSLLRVKLLSNGK